MPPRRPGGVHNKEGCDCPRCEGGRVPPERVRARGRQAAQTWSVLLLNDSIDRDVCRSTMMRPARRPAAMRACGTGALIPGTVASRGRSPFSPGSLRAGLSRSEASVRPLGSGCLPRQFCLCSGCLPGPFPIPGPISPIQLRSDSRFPSIRSSRNHPAWRHTGAPCNVTHYISDHAAWERRRPTRRLSAR
jgi:hypothetical protein